MLHVRIRKAYPRAARPFTLDVEFSAPAGFTVLFGPSGSGKTTILDCIAGLQTPDEGDITIAERTLFTAGQSLPLAQRHVAYVFQDLALFPHLTVEQNIAFGLHELPPAQRQLKIVAILQSFGITHLARQHPRQLSAGEKQRVALARSLVTSPNCLLLDEPLSALDEETRDALIADLRDWNADRRIPILYVTHSRAEATALGEQLIVLREGRIETQSTPTALFHP